MPEFRARIGATLPNSLADNGDVIDWSGLRQSVGPCFVELDKLRPARKALMGEAGWHVVRNAADWPGIPPRQRCLCIIRIKERTQ